MKPVMVDGQPLEEKKEKKRRKFRIYHRRRWHESDDGLLFKALKLQAILYDAGLIFVFVLSAYSLGRIETLPVSEDVRTLWSAMLAMIMILALALVRRPLIIVEKPEQRRVRDADDA